MAALTGNLVPVIDQGFGVVFPNLKDGQFLVIAELASGCSECAYASEGVGLPDFGDGHGVALNFVSGLVKVLEDPSKMGGKGVTC